MHSLQEFSSERTAGKAQATGQLYKWLNIEYDGAGFSAASVFGATPPVKIAVCNCSDGAVVCLL
jgi:hypothetical protein